MNQFIIEEPSLESYFRGILLFGKNTASYKFALGKTLLELAERDVDFVSEKELSIPFIKYTNEHYQNGRNQITSRSSAYFDAFQKYNVDKVSLDEMISLTINNPFKNVIDRFHTVNEAELPFKFYDKSVRNGVKGIVLTDHLYQLRETDQFTNLFWETEARWSLVETAWSIKISPNLINIAYDDEDKMLFTTLLDGYSKRTTITSSREALNGYQRGRCFYCSFNISISSLTENLTDVDHFIPFALQATAKQDLNINGIWNLVLACKECNRGMNGKFMRLPTTEYLKKLYVRNEYLISSNHPLKETLINQTGKNPITRRNFLKDIYKYAIDNLLFTWEPKKSNTNS